MIATIKITNMKILSLPLTIMSLASIMGLPMRQLRYFVPYRQTPGLKYAWKKNITTIQLRKEDLKQIKSSFEISKILSVTKIYLLSTLILLPHRLKLLSDRLNCPCWTQIMTYYLVLKSAQSLLVEKT